MKKLKEEKCHIELFTIDFLNAHGSWEKLPDFQYVIDPDESSSKNFFEGMAIGVGLDGDIFPICITEGRVREYKMIGQKLMIISEDIQDDVKHTTVHICDVRTGIVRRREHPDLLAFQLVEHILVEYDTSKKVVHLVNLKDGEIIRNYDLKLLLRSVVKNIHKVRACYAKGHLFVLIKEKETYDWFVKINIKDNSIVDIFPNQIFMTDSGFYCCNGPESGDIKWMNNRLCFFYRKKMPGNIFDEGVLIYDFAHDTIYRSDAFGKN